jgi:hypothetical protein
MLHPNRLRRNTHASVSRVATHAAGSDCLNCHVRGPVPLSCAPQGMRSISDYSTLSYCRRPMARTLNLIVDYTVWDLIDNCIFLSCRHMTVRGRRAHIYRESGRHATRGASWVARNAARALDCQRKSSKFLASIRYACRCYTAATPSAARWTSQSPRHVLGDDAASFLLKPA